MAGFLEELFDGLDSLDKQVTFAIALIGFVLSIVTFIHGALSNRKRLAFTVYQAVSSGAVAYFVMSIENKSRLPIAITSLKMETKGSYYECVRVPTLVLQNERKKGGEVIERNFHYSIKMPIDIPALGSASGYVLFEGLPHALPADTKTVRFSVGTNRGRRMRVLLQLEQAHRNLKSANQSHK